MSGLDWPSVCGDRQRRSRGSVGVGLVGDLRGRTLVSPKMDSDSLELVDCMADPRKTYGEMAWL